MLLEQISSLNEKIDVASNKYSGKSLQPEKMKQSIKIITTNAKIKEHELEVLQNGLVNAEDADRVFARSQSFRKLSMYGYG